MEYMDGGSLYEWLHSDLDIRWDVRLRYDIDAYTVKRGVTRRKEQHRVTKTE